MLATGTLPRPPARRACKSILLGLLGAKVLTSVPVGQWESVSLGPAVGFSLDLVFAFGLTGLGPLIGWTRETAWKSAAIAVASFSAFSAAVLLVRRFAGEPSEMLDLWLRWFRLCVLSGALVAVVAAFGPPVVRTDS